jgi:peptidoglycan/xylan/chitin deacetylase (PgdA/CDA1 family)
MRLAAAACALVILVGVAVLSAMLAQRIPLPSLATLQAIATPALAPLQAVIVSDPRPEPSSSEQTDPASQRREARTQELAPVTSLPAPVSDRESSVPVQATPTPGPAPAPSAPLRTAQTAVPAALPARAPAASPFPPAPQCNNPDALGIARVVEIDTTGGPGFGFEHFKQHDFLRPMEVVLTFDDGPWPKNTGLVLAALAEQCVRAVFFPIGQHAMWEPGILKQVAAAGHSIGSHTWSHKDLSQTKARFKINGKFEMREFDPKDEIEKGISAVRWAVGGPTAPFFRFPALRHPPELVKYLGERNVAMFSTDMDSFDFKMRRPEQVVQSVMTRLKKHGKGIVLMHDFQHATAEATATVLKQLKAEGYKVVHMRPKNAVTTLPQYDEMILGEMKLPTVSDRPTSSVVRTVTE